MATALSTADNSQEGSFTIQGKPYQLILTTETLKWSKKGSKNEDEVTVPVSEILSVAMVTGKVKKEGQGCLKVVYVKHKKSYKLSQATVVFTSSTDVCSHWCKTLQGHVDAVVQRPRSALVLVNPMSGHQNGPKQYKEKVSPVFSEASLKTDVKVTESADHVREIIRTYDLSSIDSIVVVGGDGMYHMVADELIQRDMREAGLDVNDSEKDIPDVSLPIGVIPCGTGNGIAVGCYGNYDIVTAALAIVIGGKQRNNTFGVWSAGQFVVYSTLLQGSGFLADLIYETEKRRSMGVWRYPAVILGLLRKSSARMMDVTVQYKMPNLSGMKSDAKETEMKTEAGNSQNDMQVQSWQTYQGRTIGLSVFTGDVFGFRETKDPAHLRFSRCLVMKEWGRIKYFQFFAALMRFSSSMLHNDNIDHWPFVEYKVKVNNPDEQNGKANLMNIDGESFHLKSPDYHCKIFPKKVTLFASVTEEFFLKI